MWLRPQKRSVDYEAAPQDSQELELQECSVTDQAATVATPPSPEHDQGVDSRSIWVFLRSFVPNYYLGLFSLSLAIIFFITIWVGLHNSAVAARHGILDVLPVDGQPPRDGVRHFPFSIPFYGN